MQTLITMYVFFDKKGNIKAITPDHDPMFENYESANFPLSEVEGFLSGSKSSFDYTVQLANQIGSTTYKIVKKVNNVVITRSLDSYITKVATSGPKPLLLITADLLTKTISIDLNTNYEEVFDDENEDRSDVFAGTTPINLYFTKKNNPYHLLHTVPFVPKDLLEDSHLEFQYSNDIDLSSSSVYTKKLISGYGYKIKGKRYVI